MTTTTEKYINNCQGSSRIMQLVQDHPHSLLYATVHGSKLYGFDTPDSDWDLRGCHVLPIEQVLGLQEGQDTITRRDDSGETGMELVTHKVKKLFRLLLNRNGNVLEEALSPLVLVTGDFHAELREIAGGCIARGHAGHYMGMARQAMKVLEKPDRQEVKSALHMYRAFLTGIHLMETGELECNLPALNAKARLPHVDGLLERRAAGPREQRLGEGEAGLMAGEFDRLTRQLQQAADRIGAAGKTRGRSPAQRPAGQDPREWFTLAMLLQPKCLQHPGSPGVQQ